MIVLCIVGVSIAFALFDFVMRRKQTALAAAVAAEVARGEAEREAAYSRHVFLSMISVRSSSGACGACVLVAVSRLRKEGRAAGGEESDCCGPTPAVFVLLPAPPSNNQIATAARRITLTRGPPLIFLANDDPPAAAPRVSSQQHGASKRNNYRQTELQLCAAYIANN